MSSRKVHVAAPDVPRDFAALLDYVKRARGFDFAGYKPASLTRRIDKRMAEVGADSYVAYTDYLEVHPEEFARLFDTVLINVSGFLRDPAAWETIAHDVIPRLLASKPDGVPVRVWSAGCATGQEAYTLAMLFAEAVGIDGFRDRVKIYATDLDDGALSQARHAVYPARELEDVPAPLRGRYFHQTEGGFAFHPELRRGVIFGRHDLIQDAPISRVDLLVCRNTLMYLNAETQGRIIVRFHFALNDGGVLFLGRAETLLTQTTLFTPIDLKRRIFEKSTSIAARERLLLLGQVLGREEGDGDDGAIATGARLRNAAFDASPVAQVVVDAQGAVAMVNERARALFGLGAGDIGRPLQDLAISYRPVELRALIDRAQAERGSVVVRDVEWESARAEPRSMDVQVSVLAGAQDRDAVGVVIAFTDSTGFRRLQRELERAHEELESAYEELQSTNEELETTNEELQSTVEELETTNEELQSSNEELETMNEELQSSNEELQGFNEQSRRHAVELDRLNRFLGAVFTSLAGAVVVLDRDGKVLVWNANAQELWGLRADEVVGQPFLDLDFGLPVEQLGTAIRGAAAPDGKPAVLTVPATNRRGRPLEVRVTCSPLVTPSKDGVQGVILTME